jgi:hypothetical protein
MFIHSHQKGVTVHVFHHSGQHEMHEHQHGDAEGIAAHVHQHHGGSMGGGEGQEQPEQAHGGYEMG